MSQPIACTLTPAQAGQRAEDTATIARNALRTRETTTDGQRLLFVDSPETEAQLKEVIAAEAECCSFLSMQLSRVDDGLQLDISGPAQEWW